MLQSLFMLRQLRQDRTELKMVLAQVAEFEELTRYVKLLDLLLRAHIVHRLVPATGRQVVRDSRQRV